MLQFYRSKITANKRHYMDGQRPARYPIVVLDALSSGKHYGLTEKITGFYHTGYYSIYPARAARCAPPALAEEQYRQSPALQPQNNLVAGYPQ